jgi:hypothetical protein
VTRIEKINQKINTSYKKKFLRFPDLKSCAGQVTRTKNYKMPEQGTTEGNDGQQRSKGTVWQQVRVVHLFFPLSLARRSLAHSS